jgi:hypothetical protein
MDYDFEFRGALLNLLEGGDSMLLGEAFDFESHDLLLKLEILPLQTADVIAN